MKRPYKCNRSTFEGKSLAWNFEREEISDQTQHLLPSSTKYRNFLSLKAETRKQARFD
jgi:hypothetical protein